MALDTHTHTNKFMLLVLVSIATQGPIPYLKCFCFFFFSLLNTFQVAECGQLGEQTFTKNSELLSCLI